MVYDELVRLMTDLPQNIQQIEAEAEPELACETPPTAKKLLLDCLREDIINDEQRIPTSSELEMEV